MSGPNPSNPEETAVKAVASIRISDAARSYCKSLAGKIVNQYNSLTEEAQASLDASWCSAFNLALGPGTSDQNRPASLRQILARTPEETCAGLLLANPRAQARMAAIVEYPPSKWLLKQELLARGIPVPSGQDVYRIAMDQHDAGICLSGGGIRSATFCLGILQALASMKKLDDFTYLSSVSGGGFTQQFLAAWIDCESLGKVEEQLTPLPLNATRTLTPDPLRWLRRYSNYLTPQKGLFTADTWTAVAIWVRNTFLNQLVLISFLLTVLFLPHLHLRQTQRSDIVMWSLKSSTEWVSAALIFILMAASALVLGYQLRILSSNQKKTGMGQIGVLGSILLPVLMAVFVASPYVYRSAFFGGQLRTAVSNFSGNQKTNLHAGYPQIVVEAMHSLAKPASDPPPLARSCCCCNASTPAKASTSRLAALKAWFAVYSFPQWDLSDRNEFPIVLIALLGGLAVLIWALLASIPFTKMSRWDTALAVAAMALALVISVGFGYLLIHLVRLLVFGAAFLVKPEHATRFGITVLPPLLLSAIVICFDLAIGVIGHLMQDADREWLARLRAWTSLFAMVWIGLFGISLFGYAIVQHLSHIAYVRQAAWIAWLGTTLGSLLAGKSSSTSGPAKDGQSAGKLPVTILIAAGPPVFITGLLLALSWVLETAILHVASDNYQYLLLLAAFVATALVFGWRVDINDFSLHSFYRDRIARAYAGASNPDRRPNRFTGFAESDAVIRVADLLPEKFRKHTKYTAPERPENLKCRAAYTGPFPIFCTTLNLSFGEDLAYQERKAAAFAFTPLYSGYDVGWTEADPDEPNVQFNGYALTKEFAYPNGGPHMSTAVAASGAAVSPNAGYYSSPAVAFLLTLFNFRLGWWIRNPRFQQFTFAPGKEEPPAPRFGFFYLLRELFGAVNDSAPFVNLTDGGHFENMGLYELVRRRCMNIVVCDGEEDSAFHFGGIGMAIRKCRIDFGVEIKLDVRKIKRDPVTQLSSQTYITGEIVYPASEGVQVGHILYIKATLSGREPADVLNYWKDHPSFPDESTANQWFSESEFESYRRLGLFSVLEATPPESSTELSPMGWFANYIP